MLCCKQLHAVPSKERNKRSHEKVGQVLVVDRVDKHPADDIRAMLRLKHKKPVVGQQPSNAVSRIVKIVEIGKGIIAYDNGGGTVLGANFIRELCCKEGRKRLDTLYGGTQSGSARRVNAKHLHAAFLEEAQQGAVIAADLNHEQAWCDLRARNDSVSHSAKMFGQAERD